MPPQPTTPASESEAGLGRDLTGLTAVSTRNVVSLLKHYWRAFGIWRRRQRSQTALHELSDRELNDIGVTRGEIDHIAPHRAIEALKDSICARGVL